MVLAAAKVAPQALQHAAPELLADRKFAEKAVKLDWRCLASVSKDLRADKRLVEAALKQSADALALTPLDAEPKVALVAVKKDGLALCHCRPSAQTKDVVLAAVKQNVEALQFVADESLLRDKDVVAAAKKRGVVLEGDDEDDLRPARERMTGSVAIAASRATTRRADIGSHREAPRRRRAGPVAVRHARLLVVVAEGRVLRRRRLERLRPAAVPGEERAAGRRFQRRAQ